MFAHSLLTRQATARQLVGDLESLTPYGQKGPDGYVRYVENMIMNVYLEDSGWNIRLMLSVHSKFNLCHGLKNEEKQLIKLRT